MHIILKKLLKLPYLPILLTPFILMAPVYLSGQAMFWGTPALQFVPWWHWAWETLRAGHLPLWNPLVGMGAPLLANYQSALFYPPTWIYFLLDLLGGVSWLAWGQAILVALHLAWAGMGMALLAQRLKMGILAQTISGLAYGLSAYLVSRSGFLSINAAASWVPWIILGVTPMLDPQPAGIKEKARNASSSTPRKFWIGTYSATYHYHPWQFLGLVVCLAMQLLAGHAQTSWYTWLLAGLWSGFWGWESGGEYQTAGSGSSFTNHLWGIIAGWLRFGLALFLGFCLAAVQLLPTAEYLLQSQRSSAVEYNFALQYSAWPWRFLSLLAPNFFGNPANGDYWGYANFWEDALYFGLLPLLLALAALTNGLRRKSNQKQSLLSRTGSQIEGEKSRTNLITPNVIQKKLVRFLFFIILVSILLALGKNTPIYPWLYNHIPTFSMFQAPARWLIWTEFSLTLLAGIGADIWKRPEKRTLYWTRLATAGAVAVSVGAGLAWYFMGDISPTFIQATALAGVWGMCAGGLSLVAMRPEYELHSGNFWKTRLWVGGVVIFVAADLLVADWGLNPGTNKDLYRDASPLAQQIRTAVGKARIYLSASDEQKLKFDRFLNFKSFNPGEDWKEMRAVLLPNMNMLDSIPSVNNFDPLVPGRYERWMTALEDANPGKKSSLLNLMGVGVVEKMDLQSPHGVHLVPLEDGGGARMRWVPCAQYALDEQDSWQQVWGGNVDFSKKLIIEQQGPVTDLRDPACQDTPNDARVSVIQDSPDRLVVELTSSSPGWFLLSDVWYPGWNAWVDGKPVRILKADYLFRAVQVDAGNHQIVMSYHPRSFWYGLALSVIAGLALSGYALRIIISRRGSGS